MLTMAERYVRPAWVRRLNGMADSVAGALRTLVPIDADALLRSATESEAGELVGDFGDAGWRKRFTSLADALDGSPLTVVGRILTAQELLRSLRTRVALTAAGDVDPGLFDEPVAAPVVVTGPARSGTSILFELLALDPALRAPVAWEALHPLPPAGAREVAHRIVLGECEQELWADVQPEFAAMHELRSDLPVECVTLTMPCFCGPHWSMISQAQGWVPEPAQMYDFHRRILQVLQRGRPDRTWLLKTPGHLFTLELLFATYPDAWVVQTHRDPAKTMPSTLSIAAMVQWMRHDDVDLDALAAGIELAFGVGLNRTVELRSSGSLPRRFVDVHFTELMRDPVRAIRSAYTAMGRELSDDHARRIERYLADKPRGKFGSHRYTPEEWGYDASELRERLAPYIEHFGVALEDGGRDLQGA